MIVLKPRFKTWLVILAVVLALVLGLLPTVAFAENVAPSCGETLQAPPNEYRLVGDVDCRGRSSDEPALTIVGPIIVDLNGYAVFCGKDNSQEGVVVIGNNAELSNGTVMGCTTGVSVGSDVEDDVVTAHTIIQVTVQRNTEYGFRVRSSGNDLHRNMARRNRARSEDTDDEGNTTYSPQGEGFRVEGNGNQLHYNVAQRNAQHGFRIKKYNDNELSHNIARKNGEEGFRIEGDGNQLFRNSALGSCDDGYRIKSGENNELVNNYAVSNGQCWNTDSGTYDSGIRVEGSSTWVYRNLVTHSFGVGILIEENSCNNRVEENWSWSNDSGDLVDASDCQESNVRYGNHGDETTPYWLD